MRDAIRIDRRCLEACAVGDGRRIEDRDIGGQTGAKQAAVAQPELRGGHRSELADRLFKTEPTTLAHVVAKDAGGPSKTRRVVHHRRQRAISRCRPGVSLDGNQWVLNKLTQMVVRLDLAEHPGVGDSRPFRLENVKVRIDRLTAHDVRNVHERLAKEMHGI